MKQVVIIALFFVAISQLGPVCAEEEDPIYAGEYLPGLEQDVSSEVNNEQDVSYEVNDDVQRKDFAGRDIESSRWNFTACDDEDMETCQLICGGDGFCAAAGSEMQPDCYCHDTPVSEGSLDYSCEKIGTVSPGDDIVEVVEAPDQCRNEIIEEDFSTQIDYYICTDPNDYFYCAFIETPQDE